MKIILNSELELFVQKQIESGMYESASEVISQALMIMVERELALTEDQLRLRRQLLAGQQSGVAAGWDCESIKQEARTRKLAMDQGSEA